MEHFIEGYRKKHDFLICFDSDGTVMDTMTVKHSQSLAPTLIETWGLEQWEKQVRALWYDINLYKRTRGINRFQALAIALKQINDSYTPIEGLPELEAWISSGCALSNASLEKVIAETHAPILKRVLSWTETANSKIGALSLVEKKPFPGAQEGLLAASHFADIVVLSTATHVALLTEWGEYGLLGYADAVLGQESGGKEHCISTLLQAGYAPDHVMMVGDAPGDLDAAKKNKIHFYPILVHHEAESWAECDNAYARFQSGKYSAYEQEKVRIFFENLGYANETI